MRTPRYLDEPFRPFFILGTLCAILGVSLWPLYYFQWLPEISGATHARLQIQGFLGLFAIGFLLTALPRLLEVRRCTLLEFLTFTALFLANISFHLKGLRVLGDVCFLFILFSLVVFFAVRFPKRKDLPPPFFGLVLVGMLHALIGTVLLVLTETDLMTATAIPVSQNMLYQGFLLCLVLGIGTFLAPRIMGIPAHAPFADSRTPPPGWWKSMFFHTALGLVVLASFILEFWEYRSFSEILRAIVGSWVLWSRMKVQEKIRADGFLSRAMKLSLVLMLLGLWVLPFSGGHRVAALHIIFIGGFGLITFVVATRVTLGHSGFEHLFRAPLANLVTTSVLFLIALVLRIFADVKPEYYFQSLAFAGIAWVLGVVNWALSYFQKILFPKPESD